MSQTPVPAASRGLSDVPALGENSALCGGQEWVGREGVGSRCLEMGA